MSKSYFPDRDAGALQFTQNFGNRIQATPEKYGQTTASAALYQGLVGAFSTKLTVATDPSTRNKGSVAAKNDALKDLKKETAWIVKGVRAQKNLTTQDLNDLGLNAIKAKQQVVRTPGDSPLLTVVPNGPRSLTVVMRDGQTKRRALPVGIKGASVFAAIGEIPADANGWSFVGSITRTTCSIDVTDRMTDAAGAVHLCAFYYDNKAQSGPASEVVTVYLPATTVKPSGKNIQPTTMRVAA